VHILIRSIGRGEDFRYANFRKQWGERVVLIAFFRVFMMQGLIMLLLAYPIIRVNAEQSNGLDLAAYLGLAVWILGFMFQVIGDYQLKQFKKTRSSKDDILNTGLWRYTRHPNYFGEATMWWAIAIILLPVQGGWIALFSSLLINLLLVKVSGVPFLDKRYAGNEAYQQYKKETNRFIPWFPKLK
jgi:steroid 5-alpha reductase family enzyme